MDARFFSVITAIFSAAISLFVPNADSFTNSAPSFECMSCHHGEVTTEMVKIGKLPRTYVPGKMYSLTLVADSDLESLGEVLGGFALAVTAGELIVQDHLHTQLSNDILTHTMEGSRRRMWKFGWKAPAEKTDVEITIMTLAANGDYSPLGDRIGADHFTLKPGE